MSTINDIRFLDSIMNLGKQEQYKTVINRRKEIIK